MKICVYGAGAIGGLIAAKLSASGQEVSLIARGATLSALQTHGIGLETSAGRNYHPVKVYSDLKDLEPQDFIIISVKQNAFNAIVKNLAAHLAPKTKVIIAMNGVPWWFLDGLKKAPEDKTLNTLDPDGILRDLIPTQNIIGCVIHLASFTPEPGVTHHKGGNRIILGEPGGRNSEEVTQIASALSQAGFEMETTTEIEKEIWFKLWGNMTMNPVSALTRKTTDLILDDPLVNQFCCRIMTEANEIGKKLGLEILQSPEERNAVTRELGAIRTSMLQDVEKGNDLEFEALVGSVHELATKFNIKADNISALYGLIRLYARPTPQ